MKKVTRERDDMRDHYDFRGGVRVKYAQRYAEGTNVVVLDPEVAAVFPNSAAVNKALHSLAEVAESVSGLTSGSSRSARLRRSSG